MILFFYNLALLTALVAGAPWWLWRMATTQKYREGLGERLGRCPAICCGRGTTSPSSGFTPFQLARCWPSAGWCRRSTTAFPGYRLLISTTTRTGQELGTRRDSARSRLLLPARSALGSPRLSQCTPAADADSRRDGILAEPAERLLSPRHSRCRRQRPHLRPLLAALSDAAAPVATNPRPADVACWRKQAPTRSVSIALGCPPELVSVSGNLKFDVRAVKEAEATSLLKSLGAACDFSLPAAPSKVKRLPCSRPGRACSPPIPTSSWCSPRGIRSASQPLRLFSLHPVFRGLDAPIGKAKPASLDPSSRARSDRSARYHRRTGLRLFARRRRLRRRQPHSRRRPQPAGAGPVRRAHRHGAAITRTSAPSPTIYVHTTQFASRPKKNWPER